MNKSTKRGSANSYLTHTKSVKGITLIALVITIVVLIILAGVAINLTLGDNGIFNKTKYAKEQHEKGVAKEELDRAILEIQTEEISEGRNVTLDILENKLPIKLSEITISKESNALKGTYKGCDFIIDENFEVTIQGYNPSKNEGQKSEVEKYRDAGTYMTKPTDVKDSDGNIIKVPQGFKIASDSGKNVTEGIVIEDDDIIEGIGNGRGNQYVWVPVGTGIKKANGKTENITLGRYKFADGSTDMASDGTTPLAKGTPILVQDIENYSQETTLEVKDISGNLFYSQELTTYREGVESEDVSAQNATALSILNFKTSVENNGGYYIARYEATYGADGKANSKVSNTYEGTNVEGKLWNYITQIDASVASRNLYETATTDLINSYAWDTAIVYIQKFSGNKEYSWQPGYTINAALTNTGVNGDELCKINDMASNTMEWSTEYIDVLIPVGIVCPAVHRGGYYGDQNSARGASDRFGKQTALTKKYYTFRTTLYM